MNRSVVDDAVGHHVWATLRLFDVCASLEPEPLSTPIAGTYGSILDTLRHLVGADAWYLHVLSGGRLDSIDEDDMSLGELRSVMEAHDGEWRKVLADAPEAATDVTVTRDDGTQSHAPAGVRLAQVVHHGTDHRSQICTALTLLGVEPPDIDVWAFGELDNRVYESRGGDRAET
jgi:uncharacterized damage-inducible protein DinB